MDRYVVEIAFVALFAFVVAAMALRRRQRARDERVGTAGVVDDPAFAAALPATADADGWIGEITVRRGPAIQHARHRDAPIVASPRSDDARLAEASPVALATAHAQPTGVAIAKLVSVEFDGSAREAALDLALADPRCAPDVLEAAARRAVAAWAQAVDGDDVALLLVATPAAAAALLYPHGQAGGRARTVVRGPVLERLAIAALHADREPPRMEVQARLRGRRYVEDRDTAAVLDGSQDREIEFAEHWTFSLEGTQAAPWVLVDAGGGA